MENIKEEIDELKEYREKLSKLSEEELKKRDLYLKKLANGTIQGPPTGFASIDKQWLQTYTDEAILDKSPSESLYGYLYRCWKNNLNAIAINFEGKKITRYEFLSNVCKLEEELKQRGVVKGDIISLAPANIPESIYSIYAINKIGAKVSIVDPRSNEYVLLEDINCSFPKPNLFIGVETVKNIFSKILSKLSIKDYIFISPMQSAPENKMKKIYSIIRKLNGNGIYSKRNNYSKIIKKYDLKKYDIKDFEKYESFENDEMAFILHTGGTTGVHKGVELTNNAINNTVYEHNFLMDGIIKPGDVFVNPLPPFITYGITSMHLGLCKQFEMNILPVPTNDAFKNAIIKNKAALAFGGPIHWENFCKSINPDKDDLNFLKVPVAGGEKIPLTVKQNVNKILKKCNCQSKLFDGYGLSETCGVFSVALNNNTIGSVGVPLVYNNIGVFNSETNEELKNGEIGEFYISGKSMMKQYHNNDSENMRTHVNINGIEWFKTGDVGTISQEKGELFIQGRIKRIFVCDVDKVYQEVMEELICTIPYVQKCVVVAIPDEKLRNVPKVHIILKEQYRNKKIEKLVTYEIEKIVSEKISKNVVPHYYEFQEEFAYTPNGKVDFKKIQNEDIKKMSIEHQKKK